MCKKCGLLKGNSFFPTYCDINLIQQNKILLVFKVARVGKGYYWAFMVKDVRNFLHLKVVLFGLRVMHEKLCLLYIIFF